MSGTWSPVTLESLADGSDKVLASFFQKDRGLILARRTDGLIALVSVMRNRDQVVDRILGALLFRPERLEELGYFVDAARKEFGP